MSALFRRPVGGAASAVRFQKYRNRIFHPTSAAMVAVVIAAVVGLLVADGGAYINGQMIQVNGGGET